MVGRPHPVDGEGSALSWAYRHSLVQVHCIIQRSRQITIARVSKVPKRRALVLVLVGGRRRRSSPEKVTRCQLRHPLLPRAPSQTLAQAKTPGGTLQWVDI